MSNARILFKLLIDIYLLLLPKRSLNKATGIVRLDAIGDFVVWLPAAQALVSHLKADQKQVILIANQLWAPWAASLLKVDHVVEVNVALLSKSLRYHLSILRTIRELRLGTIIVPAYSRIPCDGNDAIAFASAACIRIANKGYRSKHLLAGWLRCLLNLGYSEVLTTDPSGYYDQRTVSNELEINAIFVRALGVSLDFVISTLPVDEQSGVSDLQLPARPYIVIIPGGSWRGKAWPLQRYAVVAQQLVAHGFEVVVSGSAAEWALCDELAKISGGRNLAGLTSLPALTEVIRGARFVIGNDSAGIHIAVATKTHTVCVMWGGSFGRFIPYPKSCIPEKLRHEVIYKRLPCFGCTGTCPFPLVDGKVQCINNINIEDVWGRIYPMLEIE